MRFSCRSQTSSLQSSRALSCLRCLDFWRRAWTSQSTRWCQAARVLHLSPTPRLFYICRRRNSGLSCSSQWCLFSALDRSSAALKPSTPRSLTIGHTCDDISGEWRRERALHVLLLVCRWHVMGEFISSHCLNGNFWCYWLLFTLLTSNFTFQAHCKLGDTSDWICWNCRYLMGLRNWPNNGKYQRDGHGPEGRRKDVLENCMGRHYTFQSTRRFCIHVDWYWTNTIPRICLSNLGWCIGMGHRILNSCAVNLLLL